MARRLLLLLAALRDLDAARAAAERARNRAGGGASSTAVAAATPPPWTPRWGGSRAFYVTGPPDAMDATALDELKRMLPAAINATDDANHHPLNMAAYWGNLDAVRALLEAGADVSHGDINNHTPLHHAALSDAPEPVVNTIIGLLLQAGASKTIKASCCPAGSAYDIALRRTQRRHRRRFLVLSAIEGKK
jgi:hypothetical protein